MKRLLPAIHSAWSAPLLVLVATTACGEAELGRLVPTVEVVDGIEIATLGPIPGPFDPDYEWTFRVVREVPTVLGDEDEPLVFDPAAVLPLSTGELLVHDPSADRPLVILELEAPAAVARFGTKGRGPGELGQRLVLGEGGDDSLFVLDLGNGQVHRFARGGEWTSSERIATDRPAIEGALAAGGTEFALSLVTDPERVWRRELVRADPATGTTGPLLALPEATGPAAGIFQRGRVLWTTLNSGYVTMWAYMPVVHVHAPDGGRVREVRLPLSRYDLTQDEIDRQIALHGDIARGLRPGPMGLTNVLMAMNDTIFGMFQSGMWRAAEDPPLHDVGILWRMLTLRGEYVGVVSQPEDFRYLGRGDGTLWARVLDERAYPVIQELALERRRDSQ